MYLVGDAEVLPLPDASSTPRAALGAVHVPTRARRTSSRACSDRRTALVREPMNRKGTYSRPPSTGRRSARARRTAYRASGTTRRSQLSASTRSSRGRSRAPASSSRRRDRGSRSSAVEESADARLDAAAPPASRRSASAGRRRSPGRGRRPRRPSARPRRDDVDLRAAAPRPGSPRRRRLRKSASVPNSAQTCALSLDTVTAGAHHAPPGGMRSP